MSQRSRAAFFALILVQAAHSVEEYSTQLYDRFAPARFVSGLFGFDRRIGFVIFNVALVAFGLWCCFGPARRGATSGTALAWFWVVLEVLNGTIHIAWAASAAAYRPGLATAPLLVIAATILAWSLHRTPAAADAPQA
ncbi:MAG TPA: HXXEE domain-containing protein [Thermoanaerobaculia bacterium]|jgi:hypothetical protein